LTGPDHCGALLAAHGERGGGADNASVERLAAGLSRQGLEVHFGFIKGMPTIAEAMRACTAPRLLVYPLFLADGFFTRIRLPQLIAEAGPPHSGCVIEILPPLGLDPGLASLVATKASEAARTGGCPEHQVTIVLLAHGSTNDAASHRAFQEKFKLKFPLLSDPDRKTHDAYGAWGDRPGRGEGVIRSTFLVDEGGKVKKAWYGVKPDGHAQEVLEELKR